MDAHALALTCPRCHAPLALRPGAYACGPCRETWRVRDGVPSFVDHVALGGVERLMHTIYDWLAPLHDPILETLLPVLQGFPVAATRDAYFRRLELESLAAETQGRRARILDIGCGTGGNLPFLLERLPRGLDVELWALDFSAGMLALYRRRLERYPPGTMRLVHGDAHALPFAAGSFDRVFHVGGIAAYRAPARALAEMARVARRGTPIVVVDEQLDPRAELGWLRRLAFRAVTFYDLDPHAPRECLPADAVDVLEEQASPFYYCLRFRTVAGSGGR